MITEMEEIYVDKNENCRYGGSGWFEPFTTDKRELFKACQKSFGKCISKVYIEKNNLRGKPSEGVPCGWVFSKLTQYENSKKYYTQETWVHIRETE